ncbi:MAG: oligopeptide transporter, OPT family, partial [Nitrospirae bacterium]|nr:oligopeptide transporter, OPT family [Nitrospirota bacterium]
SALAAAKSVWSNEVRYVGIGAMLVGGIWTLTGLREPIAAGFRHLWRVSRSLGGQERAAAAGLLRTDHDAPLPWLLGPLLLCLLLMALLYRQVVDSLPVAILMTATMAIAAFLFSSVAAYMAGLVGSSSNPVSGVTIATIMGAAWLLVAVLGTGHPAGPAATLVIGAVVCCAAAMGGDNLQDLKTGQLVGATPWKQQIMQVVGVLAGAVVIGPVLGLLHAKYGIGEMTPDHPHPLSAPQASLMASLATGVFGGRLPWSLVGLGAALGVGIMVWDERLRSRGSVWRVPVLGVALGIYLPLKLSAAILAGGIVAELARRASRTGEGGQSGLLCSAGLVTGEALMGIVLALPIALSAIWPAIGSDPFALVGAPPYGPWPGLAALALVVWLLYRVSLLPPSHP